ncbi:MAG: roadblock/LC7 domain-containing protein [Acidimicrobiales bacterium]
MTAPPTDDHDVNWLVSTFIDRLPGAHSAVAVSSDGLVFAMSERLGRDSADELAAATSALASLAAGTARCLDSGQVTQVIIEMEGGYLFVTAIGDGSTLAIMCEPTCDIGLVGYEMSLLVARIGQVLTPALRAQLQDQLPR